jgi:glycosidase
MQDLVDLVKKAHKEKMYVILDWVANHTSWDNKWVTEHPDWYTHDSTGNMISPYDWSDVADLNYDNKELRDTMTSAMKFWLKRADIDGFRCDVAAMVPTDFWDSTRNVLEKIKPVFMLAEAEEPALMINAFDMDYSWKLYNIMHEIAIGKKDANAIEAYYEGQDTLYPSDAYRMLFTSNHDENSWNGTEYEKFGAGVLTFAVLTATLPGMPLIYNGQESAYNHRLAFFTKDSIDWKDYSLAPFYRKLLALKHIYQPLWNGNWGGELQRINTSADSSAFIFMREKEGEKIFVLTNLTDQVINPKLEGDKYSGKYKEWFSEEEKTFDKNMTIRLKPWEYRVYVMVHR